MPGRYDASTKAKAIRLVREQARSMLLRARCTARLLGSGIALLTACRQPSARLRACRVLPGACRPCSPLAAARSACRGTCRRAP